jgi:hypothetical protein
MCRPAQRSLSQPGGASTTVITNRTHIDLALNNKEECEDLTEQVTRKNTVLFYARSNHKYHDHILLYPQSFSMQLFLQKSNK